MNEIESITPEDIVRIKARNKFTNAELAELIGVTQPSVDRWLRGERVCRGEYARKILELDPDFKKDVHELEGEIQVNIKFNNLKIKNDADKSILINNNSEGKQLKNNQFIAIGLYINSNKND